MGAENRVRITIEIPPEQAVQGVARVVDALDGLGDTARQSGRQVDAALTSTTAKTQELGRAGEKAADTIEAAYRKLGMRSGNAIRADIAETIAAYKRLANSGQTSGNDLATAFAAAKKRVGDLRSELARVKAVDGLKEQTRLARQFSAELGQIEALAKTAGTALASYLSIRGLADMAAEIMAVGMQTDALRNSLKTATGDSASAATEMAFVRDEANRLGLELLSTGQAYAKLANAAKGTALEGEQTQKIFSGVAEASRALHLSADDTSGVLLSLTQMMSKGQVQAEELRGQMGERLPGAFQLAATAMGVTTSELDKMLSQGQVLAVDLLPKLADALHQAYGAGAAEAATSAAAEMERLKNTVAEYKDMVYSAFSDDLAGAIRSTTELLDKNKEAVSQYLLGAKGYANDAANEIKKIGDEADVSAEKIINAIKRVSVFGAALDVVKMIGDKLREKGQEVEQHVANKKLLDEILDIAKNGQKPSLKSYSQDEYNKMMGLSPSYDASKLMTGVPLSALSKLEKTWSNILPKIEQVNKEISSGKLQGTGLEKALEDRAKLYDGLSIAQTEYSKSLTKGSKAEANAATAAARYGEQASAYLDSVTQSLQSMEDSLTGGVNREADRVDKWFTQAINRAQKAMIGAKGDTSAYKQSIDLLTSSYQKFHDLAVAKDTIASLKEQAAILRDIAQALGDPALQVQASDADATAWVAETAQKIQAQAASQASAVWDAAVAASKQAGADTLAIWQGVADEWAVIDQDRADKMRLVDEAANHKRLSDTVNAYEQYKGVSDTYWEARKQLLEEELTKVKQVADDETAYKIYAAQQWDAYNKDLLEQQAASAGSFAETLSAKWALAFGSYKSEATKAKETWDQIADSIIHTTDDMIDGLAGGVGDMVRGFASGTADIESLWRNMLSRMADAAASFFEDWARRSLKDLVSGWFSDGAGSGGSGSGGGSALADGLSSLKSLGGYIGRSTGEAFGSYLSTAASSGATMFAGSGNALADIFSDGIDASQLGSSTLWTSEATQGAVSASTMASTYSAAEKAAMSGGSLLSTLGSTLGVIGAVGGLVGLATSLFSSETKTEKTGSGYKISINAGELNLSGVDFYRTTTTSGLGGTSTSHSTVETWLTDPDVAKQIVDALKDVAESIHDSAKALGIVTGDLFENLSMPEMTLTGDQLDSYIRNAGNVMAYQALDNAGLRGAFDAVAEKYEVYEDEIKRLGDAYSLVGGYTEAYGYDLESLAGITQDQIDALRETNTEVAQGTTPALLAMASAMGATSDQIAQLTANATDGSQALEVTDEQLSKILQADYASQLIDAVGGEDAFQTVMTNLMSNVLTTLEDYQAQADYYTGKANDSIAELSASGVTIDNFWQSFDEAMRSGLSVDAFERWTDVSGWVANLNTMQDAIKAWDDSIKKANQDLDVRYLRATNQDQLAKITELLADQEWELAAAREAGYDAALIARIQTVQATELAQAYAEAAEEYWQTLEDLAVREKRLANDPYADASEAVFDNAWKYQDYEASGLYSQEDLDRIRRVQEDEIAQMYDDIAASVEENAQTAHARLLRALGQTDAADLYDQQIAAASALADALESGLYTAQAYAELVEATERETQNLIEKQAREQAAYANSVASRLLTAQGRPQDAALLDAATQAESDLYDARARGLEGTQTYIQLEEALRLERANLVAEQAADERAAVAALNARLLRAQGLSDEAAVVEALASQEAELTDAREAGYSAATRLLMAQVQAAELARQALDQLNQVRADWADLQARAYAAAGDDTMASWTRLLEQQRQEIYEALSDGKSQEYLDQLRTILAAERDTAWQDLQDQAWQDHLDDLNETLADLKDTMSDLVSELRDAMGGIMDMVSSQLSDAQGLLSDARTAGETLSRSIDDLTTGSDSPLSDGQRATALAGQIDTAYRTMTSAGHGAARIEAANDLASLAQQYLSAMQASGNQEEYLAAYLDTMTKLREAQSISGEETNYYTRIADALEAEQSILNMILDELAKEDPNTEKLAALIAASQAIGSDLSGIYADTTGEGASWRQDVSELLRAAGYSDADITAALGGPTSTSSFLAQLAQFNQVSMPTYINQILQALNDIKDIAGDLDTPAPHVDPPDPGDDYTPEEQAWAANLRVAMSQQAYGGRSNWTVDEILSNLATYAGWGAAYGITDTQGYALPDDVAGQYYYAKTAQINASGGTSTWQDIQYAIASTYGSGNIAAHWLGAGYKEDITFPGTDPVLYKTVQYIAKKWRNNPSIAPSPLQLAQKIADIMGIGYDNSNATLEYIARQHYDTYVRGLPYDQLDPGDRGLIQPYALGGLPQAGTWGLVGERGPELVHFGVTSQVIPTSQTSGIFDGLAAAIARWTEGARDERRARDTAMAGLRAELREGHTKLYAVLRSIAKSSKDGGEIIEKWDHEGMPTGGTQ